MSLPSPSCKLPSFSTLLLTANLPQPEQQQMFPTQQIPQFFPQQQQLMILPFYFPPKHTSPSDKESLQLKTLPIGHFSSPFLNRDTEEESHSSAFSFFPSIQEKRDHEDSASPSISSETGDQSPTSKMFTCPHCDYGAKQKQHLLNHMRTHSGEKPFPCPYCDYRASQKQHLNVHIRTHTGEKPFHCMDCDYKTSDQAALVKHMRTHTGERPYACPYCPYKATLKVHLTIHLRTHTGEKPFECPFCVYTSAQSVSLKKHIEHNHQEKIEGGFIFRASECFNVQTKSQTQREENDKR